MKTVRGLLVATVAAAMLAGCSSSSTPTDTLSSASPTPPGDGATPPLSATQQRQIGVYVALLEEHLFIEPGLFATAYIDPHPGHDGEALSPRVRDAISDHFLPRMDVRWGVAAGSEAAGGDVDYVHLPALPENRDAFRVVVGDTCGNLCGHSQRYHVTRQGERWKATPTGAMAIS